MTVTTSRPTATATPGAQPADLAASNILDPTLPTIRGTWDEQRDAWKVGLEDFIDLLSRMQARHPDECWDKVHITVNPSTQSAVLDSPLNGSHTLDFVDGAIFLPKAGNWLFTRDETKDAVYAGVTTLCDFQGGETVWSDEVGTAPTLPGTWDQGRRAWKVTPSDYIRFCAAMSVADPRGVWDRTTIVLSADDANRAVITVEGSVAETVDHADGAIFLPENDWVAPVFTR